MNEFEVRLIGTVKYFIYPLAEYTTSFSLIVDNFS